MPRSLLDRHYKNIIIIIIIIIIIVIELIWPFLCREAKGSVNSLVNLRGQEDSLLGLFDYVFTVTLLLECRFGIIVITWLGNSISHFIRCEKC